jgi:uncharacterized protein
MDSDRTRGYPHRAFKAAFVHNSINIGIWAALLAWFLAQAAKFIAHLHRKGEIDFSLFVRTGGMPSSHSAFVSALATSVGVQTGLNSPVFAVVLGFAIIVMFDAQSFRRAAGQQARILNQIVQELFKEHHLSTHRVAEFLGHTRMEVFVGMALGIAVALAVHAVAA